MNHILKSQQFSRKALDALFAQTDHMRKLYDDTIGRKGLTALLQGQLIYPVFYEPSSRTRYSFCSAAANLGMRPIWTESAGEFSSAVKGESLEDTIRVLCEYDPTVIVLRHPKEGAAERAAAVVDKFGYKVSIINAGDGKGQHPTQALLDLYTIRRELGRIDGLRVTIGGDLLNGRAVRSLVYLLSKYKGVKLTLLSPKNLRLGTDLKQHLREHGVEFIETQNMKAALTSANIIYWTRIQKERGSKNNTLNLRIGPRELKWVSPDARILHPLPRVDEIDPAIDGDPRAAYFRQTKNGMFIRMALLQSVSA